ncbi:hypothetical protein L9F63_004648, partial [Diploptera punctata]
CNMNKYVEASQIIILKLKHKNNNHIRYVNLYNIFQTLSRSIDQNKSAADVKITCRIHHFRGCKENASNQKVPPPSRSLAFSSKPLYSWRLSTNLFQ